MLAKADLNKLRSLKMRLAAIFVLALAAFGSVSGSEPVPRTPRACDLPSLPNFYSTALLINVETTERLADADADADPKRPIQYVGQSLSAAEFVDETMGRAVLDLEYG